MTGDLILCDTHGCKSELPLGCEMGATAANLIVWNAGWHVTVGTARSYHRCPQCRPQTVEPANDFLRRETR